MPRRTLPRSRVALQFRFRFRAGVVVAATCGWAATASAQTVDDSARAERLFSEASALAERGEFLSACPKFEESQRLDPAIGTQFNLALCYRHVGRLGSAWRNFDSVERLAHSAGKTGREQAAHHELNELRTRAPHFVFSVPDPDVSITVDGERVAPADLAFYAVDPGDHKIVATASAKTPWQTVRTLSATPDGAGSAEPVAVPALAAAAGKTRVVTVTREEFNTKRSLSYVLLAVGGVGAATAVVTGVLVLKAKSTAKAECTPRCIDDDGVSAVNRGKTLLPINAVSWIVGVAGLGAGTFLYLTAPPKEPAKAARLEPLAGPGMGGLALSGAF